MDIPTKFEGMSREIKKEFRMLKNNIAWQAIQEIVNEIIKDECDIENVPRDLSAEDYKAEVIGRLKAKDMFEGVFQQTEEITELTENEDIDYS